MGCWCSLVSVLSCLSLDTKIGGLGPENKTVAERTPPEERASSATALYFRETQASGPRSVVGLLVLWNGHLGPLSQHLPSAVRCQSTSCSRARLCLRGSSQSRPRAPRVTPGTAACQPARSPPHLQLRRWLLSHCFSAPTSVRISRSLSKPRGPQPKLLFLFKA